MAGATIAAWVQAVGALLALGVAIGLSQRQQRYEKERRRLGIRERHLGAVAVLEAVLGNIEHGMFRPFELEVPNQILSTIALADLPAEAARRVVLIRQLVNTAQFLISESCEKLRSLPEMNDMSASRSSHTGVYPSAEAAKLLAEIKDILRSSE